MDRCVTVAVAFALLAAVARGQSPAPAGPSFDVASVKLNTSGAPFRMGPVLQPGGRVLAINLTLRDLVRAAYGVEDNQLVGGPGWIHTAQFDVEARGPADLTREQGALMLRGLLAERFQLATHRETRQLPLYRLVMARRDRTPGPRLKPSGPDCAPITPPAGMPVPPPPPPPAGGGVPLTATDATRLKCGTAMFPGGTSARTTTMKAFATLLAFMVGRPVVDDTMLPGEFDLDLTFTPEFAGPAALAQPSASAPSLFTALDEQLGLKLEPARGPVDVVVIDRVARSRDN